MMKSRTGWRLTAFLILSWYAGALAFGQPITVVVSAPDHAVPEAPVSLLVSRNSVPSPADPRPGETPAQAEPAPDGKVRLTWIVHDLKKGETRTYRLVPARAKPGSGVEVKRNGANLDILMDGRLFTRYDVTTGPNKPYFYPLIGPTGISVVRHWPMEKVAGETNDHPHHRGLWFTHGDVNGADFWTEGKGTGKTVHAGYGTLTSGPVYGLMRAKTDWIMPDGKKVAEDEREVRVYDLESGPAMDFTITLKAVNGPLRLGDTKEGTFGMRLADSLRATHGGTIRNSNGVEGAKTWGLPAEWVDYYGPLEGETVGVTIMDHPLSYRHPTTWHVRDYGLFAANPFGLHDFDPKLKDDRRAGALTVPEGESVTFRYRLLFHRGDTQAARVEEAWESYKLPPFVKLSSP